MVEPRAGLRRRVKQARVVPVCTSIDWYLTWTGSRVPGQRKGGTNFAVGHPRNRNRPAPGDQARKNRGPSASAPAVAVFRSKSLDLRFDDHQRGRRRFFALKLPFTLSLTSVG